jgi:hypothetical protein
MTTWNPTTGGPESIRRRSQRVFVSVPVTVDNEGESKDAAFTEETHTLVVNAHGALIGLAAKIEKGQTLRVRNRATGEEQISKVVYLGPASGDKAQIGVEFTSRAPDFWRIAFPPEDWTMSPQAPNVRENNAP